MVKMTERQRRFADKYIKTGNISQSYKTAYPNVKKDSAARASGSRLLTKANVKFYIDERLKELKKEAIADQDEILQYLTSVMRGEVSDEQLLVIGDGEFGSEVGRHSKRSDTSDRTKAAELLGKRYVMWTDKNQVENITPEFIEDVPYDDD
ncbi:terminase small subunit [Halobacillus sp. Nhm2S1]|uniref:terminase small subunit n=1 Tax=Halobacillus sp. Nhm2S1 TaxID=2866716 RepID=UPI001C73B1E4|nr:terminase small subunit [Halobacillus sp. Nhm2S1]MBX0358931.1 terminase small subunit [Halobacillus sp. Nhm2S1]